MVGNPTRRFSSAHGKVYYVNDIRHTLSMVRSALKGLWQESNPACVIQDMSNPLRRKYLHFYPELSQCPSEVWHFDKWLNAAPDAVLTPMAIINGRSFYVQELISLRDRSYFYVERWIESSLREHTKGGAPVMVAKGRRVEYYGVSA